MTETDISKRLYDIPRAAVLESLYSDFLNLRVLPLYFGPAVRGVEYSIALKYEIIIHDMYRGEVDTVSAELIHTGAIMSDILCSIGDDTYVHCTTAEIDSHIAENIKNELAKHRAANRVIIRVSFVKTMHDGPWG
ncbi:hypothetical protein Metho_1239 [Methanomethylovorans hollandica DSM 15978]|uniref:Uncharacterized protein n=1 Tax=Methanomethylovorans hollandica (strain DSM 15978 / NBRC 107637 / DMS1) TaxID=867904 RepID=L0KZQ1_METHD|nr:hypothetical protein [Methanomethylovorans hollandica]AGB49469.1 hypothetical protein Metho_1239 [Methanomethylovorans hollandica DSM 15978]